MHALLVDPRETDGVHSRDAQFETAIVRRVDGNQASQFCKVWLARPANSGRERKRRDFAVSLQDFEDTSFTAMI